MFPKMASNRTKYVWLVGSQRSLGFYSMGFCYTHNILFQNLLLIIWVLMYLRRLSQGEVAPKANDWF